MQIARSKPWVQTNVAPKEKSSQSQRLESIGQFISVLRMTWVCWHERGLGMLFGILSNGIRSREAHWIDIKGIIARRMRQGVFIMFMVLVLWISRNKPYVVSTLRTSSIYFSLYLYLFQFGNCFYWIKRKVFYQWFIDTRYWTLGTFNRLFKCWDFSKQVAHEKIDNSK